MKAKMTEIEYNGDTILVNPSRIELVRKSSCDKDWKVALWFSQASFELVFSTEEKADELIKENSQRMIHDGRNHNDIVVNHIKEKWR